MYRYRLLTVAALVAAVASGPVSAQRPTTKATAPKSTPAVKATEKTTEKAPDRPATQQEKDAAAAAGAGIFGMSMACFIFVLVSGALFYFAPTLIALLRRHPNIAPIIIVNTFLGWSLIGWVLAMAWAFTAQEGPRPRGRRSHYDD